MPEALLSSPITTLPEPEPLDWLRSPTDNVAGAGARRLVVVTEHDVAGDEAARLVAVAGHEVAGTGAEAELSSPVTRLPEMKPSA